MIIPKFTHFGAGSPLASQSKVNGCVDETMKNNSSASGPFVICGGDETAIISCYRKGIAQFRTHLPSVDAKATRHARSNPTFDCHILIAKSAAFASQRRA